MKGLHTRHTSAVPPAQRRGAACQMSPAALLPRLPGADPARAVPDRLPCLPRFIRAILGSSSEARISAIVNGTPYFSVAGP